MIRALLTAALVVLWPAVGLAQPAITGTSGTVSHGGTVTITGSGFGSDASPGPAIWDPGDGTDILTLWDGCWPDAAANATYRAAYRTPAAVGLGVDTAHARVTKYLSGANYGSGGANLGYNVMCWTTEARTWPWTLYLSWYYRLNPSWTMASDTNHKWFDFSMGGEPYTLPQNWYLESYAGPADFNTHLNDDNTAPRVVGWTYEDWYGDYVPLGNDPDEHWLKIEVEARITNGATGYVHVWMDGVSMLTLDNDTTDGTAMGADGATRAIAFGGYSQILNTNQWRFFNDIYYDVATSTHIPRVYLCSGSTWAARGTCELQRPSAWSTTSIDVTANFGALSDGSTKYVYVKDATGGVNSNGTVLSAGGGGGAGSNSTKARIRLRAWLDLLAGTAALGVAWQQMRRAA